MKCDRGLRDKPAVSVMFLLGNRILKQRSGFKVPTELIPHRVLGSVSAFFLPRTRELAGRRKEPSNEALTSSEVAGTAAESIWRTVIDSGVSRSQRLTSRADVPSALLAGVRLLALAIGS
jgi:hypothetical protein